MKSRQGGWKRTEINWSNQSKILVRFPIFLVFQSQVHSRAAEYSESCREFKEARKGFSLHARAQSTPRCTRQLNESK